MTRCEKKSRSLHNEKTPFAGPNPVRLATRAGMVSEGVTSCNQSNRGVPKTPTAAMFMLERSSGISLQHSPILRRKIARELGSAKSPGSP